MPADSTNRPVAIPALTGVRAVAAIWVLLHHLLPAFALFVPALHALAPWTENGFLGVDVFFVLSGFVIAHNYADRLAGAARSLRSYFVARVARLYPVHVLSLLLVTALVVYSASTGTTYNADTDFTVGTFLGNLLMLQAVPGVDAWNNPAWSISCELAAYLVFPLFAAMVLRCRRATAVAAAVAVLAAQLTITMLLPAGIFWPAVSWVRIAGEFTVGCLAWAAWRHGVRRGPWRDGIGVAAAGGTLLLLLFVPERGAATFLVVPLLAVAVVAAASATGPLRALLATRPFDWLGRLSYSLYLTHCPVIVVLFLVLSPATLFGAGPGLVAAYVFAYLTVVLGVATATYYLVEEPARRHIRRRTAERHTDPRDATTDSPLAIR